MSYGLKYIATYTRGGGSVTLHVYQKDYSGGYMEIGNMTGLSLEIGGGSDPIYTPIVKTTVRFSMIDAPDMQVSGSNVKTGGWEEFYTQDATKYKVVLLSGGSAFWSGFITPDSWEEEMYHHGELTITARDMIGSLSDYDFDDAGDSNHPGTQKVSKIIENAVAKSQAAMSVSCDSYYALVTAAGSSIFNTYVSLEAFKGRSWWDALTDLLESLGLIMRYTGGNTWTVTSLRYVTNFAGGSTVEFLNRTGFRQMDPPVKDIHGEFEVEKQTYSLVPPTQNFSNIFENTPIIYGDVSWADVGSFSKLLQPSGDWSATDNDRFSLFIRPLRAANFDLPSCPFLLCNTGQATAPFTVRWNYGHAKTKVGILSSPVRVVIAQDGPLAWMYLDGSEYKLSTMAYYENVVIKSVCVYISNGNGQYLTKDGTWVSGTEKANSADTTSGALDPLELSFDESGVAYIDIEPASGQREGVVVDIVHVKTTATSNWYAVYAPLRVSMDIPATTRVPDVYAVTTQYSDANNVRISRTPKIGAIDTYLPARLFKNILLDDNGNALPNSFSFGSGQGLPLEVMVQAQFIQTYQDSTSIFTGTLHPKAGGIALPGAGFTYYGRSCAVLRGTYDFTTGWLRDAAIRECLSWSGTFTADYTVVEEYDESAYGTGGSSSSGGGGSSQGGGGGASWGTESNNKAPLTAAGVTKTVCLDGHGHTTAQVTHGSYALSDLIPTQASNQNQLADKSFVNSSIATATATFRGTSAAGLTEQQFLTWAYNLPAYDQNDYIFWNTVDAAGNTQFKRYKFSGASWVYEYTLNNSSFTAAQWAAINSGITSGLVDKLDTLPSSSQLSQTLAGKQDVLTFDDNPTQNSSNPVKSGGVYNGLAARPTTTQVNTMLAQKQNLLTFDTEPTQGSTNPVTSGGIYDALTGASPLVSTLSLSAPRIEIWRQTSKNTTDWVGPSLRISHPLLSQDTGKYKSVVVLMRWSDRRARPAFSDELGKVKYYDTYRNGWGEAQGRDATVAAPTWTLEEGEKLYEKFISVEEIRTWILHHYLCGWGTTKQRIEEMTMSYFRGDTGEVFRFGAKHSDKRPAGMTFATWKAKTKSSALFGLAMRYENPEFLQYVLHGAEVPLTMRSIVENGRLIPRYIYSQVAPFRVFCLDGQDKKPSTYMERKWELGIRLGDCRR